MSAQLRLFPLPRPLVDRLGADFFKAAPRAPGVYIMRGPAEQILYIGQSKNLRARLAYYKNANPDRVPRRLVRLVHSVEHIALETCSSPAAARARELELLQTHRPKFNRADTGPRFFHYVSWNQFANELTIEINFEEPMVGRGAQRAPLRGPLKGRLIPTLALVSLQRLWFVAHSQPTRCDQLPMFPTRAAVARITGPSLLLVTDFLAGDSDRLCADLHSACAPAMEPALATLIQSDIEMLSSWFRVLGEDDFPNPQSAFA